MPPLITYPEKVTVWIKKAGSYAGYDRIVVDCRYYDNNRRTIDKKGNEVISMSQFECELFLDLNTLGEIKAIKGSYTDEVPIAKSREVKSISSVGADYIGGPTTRWEWYI